MKHISKIIINLLCFNTKNVKQYRVNYQTG